MIYPLKDWKKLKRGYKFSEKTFYSGFHLGLDVIAPTKTQGYAWQDLEVTSCVVGKDAGITAFIKCPNNKRLFRLCHLAEMVKVGKYKEGDKLFLVGNTGAMSTGSHLHMDISKNGKLNLKDTTNFEDPEAYFDTFVKNK
jgi:murein DD-endopeptidase MepM/ murein hydrolase activator NlpD